MAKSVSKCAAWTALAILFTAPASADTVNSYTGADGAVYTIVQQRPFTDTLTAMMVRIDHDGAVILMEMALDCTAERYGSLGMTFDLPREGDLSADIEDLTRHSDSIRTSRIGGVSLTTLDANLENDSVIALFDMGCARG